MGILLPFLSWMERNNMKYRNGEKLSFFILGQMKNTLKEIMEIFKKWEFLFNPAIADDPYICVRNQDVDLLPMTHINVLNNLKFWDISTIYDYWNFSALSTAGSFVAKLWSQKVC